jgi:hypothetical protein
MQKLPSSQGVQRVSAFQSRLPVLWSEGDSVAGKPAYPRYRMQPAAQGHVGGVGRVRPPRGEDQRVGGGEIMHWPGRGHGVRAPAAGETPLSIGEVIHGVREGIINFVVFEEGH